MDSLGQFFFYPELLPELRGEVRQQCAQSARMLLGLTCRAEYRLMGPPARAQRTIAFALARERENRLLARLLFANNNAWWKQNPLYAHSILHVFMKTGNLGFYHTVTQRLELEYETCSKCPRYATQANDRVFLTKIMDTYDEEFSDDEAGDGRHSAANIVTVEAIRKNRLDLLQWLIEHGRFESNVILYYVNRSPKKRWQADAINWWNALVFVQEKLTDQACESLYFALLESVVARQWSLDQIVAFILEKIVYTCFAPEQFTLCDVSHDEVLEYYALRLYFFSLVYDNMRVMEATWLYLTTSNDKRDQVKHAIAFLSTRDDAEMSRGRRLLLPSALPWLDLERFKDETKHYLRRLFGRD